MNVQPATSEPFVLEGTLTEVHSEVGRQNLLSKVLKHYKGQSVDAGVAAVVCNLLSQARIRLHTGRQILLVLMSIPL